MVRLFQWLGRFMRRCGCVRERALCAAAAGLLAHSSAAASAQTAPPVLHTNEAEINEAMKPYTLAIDDPLAVFAFVLGQLPERVQVYPTENYYYFRFVHNGVPYDGNIRLAAASRDRGEVAFAYGEQPTDWNEDPPGHQATLGAAQGVTVEKLAPLLYRISLGKSAGGRSVIFVLNDLSQARPPSGLLTADEEFIGPVFDESGIRFFLVFNRRLKVFHFLLDETVKVGDAFFHAKVSDRILLGKRTGFAFYQDAGRKILIGANAHQSWLNTAYDGPFDQLPENFIEGETLRDAIVAADPKVKGKIDRLGYFSDGSSRYLIHPYLLYRRVSDLAIFHRCATAKSVAAKQRPRCFVIDHDEAGRRRPLPLALKGR
jgi:hypothetical protein